MSHDAFLAQYRAHLETILAPTRAEATKLKPVDGTPATPETLRAIRAAHDLARDQLAALESAHSGADIELDGIEYDLDELEADDDES